MQLHLEVIIDAPAERVFAALVDVERWPERISAITGIEMLTAGPLAEGSRFRETRRMFGRDATEEMTVAELQAPARLVLTAFNHGTDYRVTHLLAAAGPKTRLTLVFAGEPRTLTARLLAPLGSLMAGSVRSQIEGDLADLRRHIEGG